MVLALLLTLQAPKPNLIVSDDASNSVASAMSHDTRHGMTLCNDGIIRIWDFPAGRHARAKLASATPFGASLSTDFDFGNDPSVDMSTDGSYFAVGFKDTVQVWQTSPLRRIRADRITGKCDTLAWALKQNLLFVHSHLPHADVAGSTVIPLSGSPRHLDLEGPWTFSPRGDSVLGLTAGGLSLGSLRSFKIIRRFADTAEILGPYAFSPDGAYLVTGGEDPKWHLDIGDFPGAPTESAYVHTLLLSIWRVKSGKKIASLTGFGSSDGDASIHFQSPRRFTAVHLGEFIACPSGRVVKRFEFSEPRTDGWVLRTNLPGSPGRTASFPTRSNTGSVGAFNTDGSRFALRGGTAGAADVAEFLTKPLALIATTKLPAKFLANFVLYSPEGQLLTGTVRQMMRIRDGNASPYVGADGEPFPVYAPHIGISMDHPSEVTTLKPESPRSNDSQTPQYTTQQQITLARSAWIVGLSATPDGRFALAIPEWPTPGYPRELRMIDLTTGKTVWSETRYPFNGIPTLSSDGSVVAVCGGPAGSVNGDKQTIWLLDGTNGSEIDRIPMVGYIAGASVSPDGTNILAGTNSGISVFDRKAHRLRFTILLNEQGGNPKIFYSPNGRRIYRLNGDSGLTAYDSETGRLCVTFLRYGLKDWVAWAPSGDIAGTPGGIAHLYLLSATGARRISATHNAQLLSRALTG